MVGESHEEIEKRDAQDTKRQLRIFANGAIQTIVDLQQPSERVKFRKNVRKVFFSGNYSFSVNYIIYRPFPRGIRPGLKALHVISFKYQWRITQQPE